MPFAKVTSKGQVTIPLEIRQALGIDTGDFVAFEAREDYVTVTRRPTAREYFSALRKRHPSGPARYASDDEAIAAYFAALTEEEIWGGDELLIVKVGSRHASGGADASR